MHNVYSSITSCVPSLCGGRHDRIYKTVLFFLRARERKSPRCLEVFLVLLLVCICKIAYHLHCLATLCVQLLKVLSVSVVETSWLFALETPNHIIPGPARQSPYPFILLELLLGLLDIACTNLVYLHTIRQRCQDHQGPCQRLGRRH